MQSTYDNSSIPQITTATTTPLVIQRGGAVDTEEQLLIQNGVGADVWSVAADGSVFQNSYLQFTDISTPTNPLDGKGRLYKKTGDDGLFWLPNSAGAEVDLTTTISSDLGGRFASNPEAPVTVTGTDGLTSLMSTTNAEGSYTNFNSFAVGDRYSLKTIGILTQTLGSDVTALEWTVKITDSSTPTPVSKSYVFESILDAVTTVGNTSPLVAEFDLGWHYQSPGTVARSSISFKSTYKVNDTASNAARISVGQETDDFENIPDLPFTLEILCRFINKGSAPVVGQSYKSESVVIRKIY